MQQFCASDCAAFCSNGTATRSAPVAARLNIEQPPQVALGDYAMPVAFELARPLRRSPKQIAAELLESLNASRLPDLRALKWPARATSMRGSIAARR